MPARVIAAIVTVIVLATGAGVVTVWPHHVHHTTDVVLDRAHGDDRVALLLVFALALVALSAALRALLAIVAGVAIVAAFALPSLLDGRDPLVVAIVTSVAVLLISLALARGFGATTAIAVIGSSAGVLVAGALAKGSVVVLHVRAANVVDEPRHLAGTRIDVEGLLLAAVVIGAIGALHAVAISQADAAVDVRREAVEPLSRRDALVGALRRGSERTSAAMRGLAFAYVGAALPVLLLLTTSGPSAARVLRTDLITVELMRSLVGLLGLAATAPLTALVATLVLHGATFEASQEDPRKYRNRHERRLWEAATAAEPVLPDRPDRAL
ncbi:MAG: hypothetical protein V7636_1110 [Actinomycetota bacterium]